MMSDTPPPPHRGDLFELAASALQAALLPFGRGPEARRSLGRGKTRPVILLHGLGAHRSATLVLQVYLTALGFDRVFAHGPPSTSGPEVDGVAARANALEHMVEGVAEGCRIGSDSVDLVAHGLGGLIARLYLQERGGAKRVDRCVCLATPHAGSTSPTWALSGLAADLQPGSAFLHRLNDPARRAPGVRYSSLWGDRDLAVLPPDSAIYPQGEAICLPGVGHMGLLIHPLALQFVAKRLATGQTLPRGRLSQAANLARFIGRAGRSLLPGLSRNPEDRT